ncbi:hypothetical protein OH460_08835 [Vibrio sp. Makdt]|uniref:hypothetical protein n=1 Tax=Vibrio sp. Makdt TaxID=2998828 RepID=UPI0022CD7CF0|nr:hypothetical protein [Vibrio sp. Makdt]MDA0152406.1 hypothetical protein [Vibrio sp. Makdt]
MTNQIKTTKETIETKTETTVNEYGFKTTINTTTRTVIRTHEVNKVTLTKSALAKRSTLKGFTKSNKFLPNIKSNTRSKSRFQRALLVVNGYFGYLQGMAYGVGGGALSAILTGTGVVDVNVKLFVASSALITITGLVKVYFDVQFKDSG